MTKILATPSELAGDFTPRAPEGDNRDRLVCDTCGFINYVNPKVIVGAVCIWEEQVLLCRRSIEPRSGYWTIPAGFMEEQESTAEGAAREAKEEALADIEVDGILAIYDIPRISHVQIIYRAHLKDGKFGVGEETTEAALFHWDDIPWDDLAFPTNHWALNQYAESKDGPLGAPFGTPEAALKKMRAG